MDHLKIADERKKLGLSQEELAEKIGVSQKSISKYERGTRRPTYETLLKMSSLFGVTVDYLLGNEKTEKIHKNDCFFFFFDNLIRDVFVARLSKAMAEKEMSLDGLAEAASINLADCTAYSKGEYEPSIENLINISQALDVSIDYLLGQTDIQTEKAVVAFKQLSEDNKDIVIGEIKKALRDQRYESVAAEEAPLKKAK